jgi:UDP-N-acetylglucosamine acyltransferase
MHPDTTIIHPSAVVEKGAQLGSGVSIGPLCHVGADAVIGDRTELTGHVTIIGATTLGGNCKVYPNAVLGAPPQNTKHKGGRTTLVIGSDCTIREGVTMHIGTDTSRGETSVGDNGNFLAFSHVAHDCIVGRNVTMANMAVLGGHCEIGDFVTMGGLSGAHQFCRIGHHAFIGGLSAVLGDVIPYGMVSGPQATLRGFNVIGMKRSGMPRQDILAMRSAYRLIFDRARPVTENLDRAAVEFADCEPVQEIIGFIRNRGRRHLVVPALDGIGNDDADADL